MIDNPSLSEIEDCAICFKALLDSCKLIGVTLSTAELRKWYWIVEAFDFRSVQTDYRLITGKRAEKIAVLMGELGEVFSEVRSEKQAEKEAEERAKRQAQELKLKQKAEVAERKRLEREAKEQERRETEAAKLRQRVRSQWGLFADQEHAMAG